MTPCAIFGHVRDDAVHGMAALVAARVSGPARIADNTHSAVADLFQSPSSLSLPFGSLPLGCTFTQ